MLDVGRSGRSRVDNDVYSGVSVKPPVVDGTPVTGAKLANADQKVVGYGGRDAEVLIANLYR
jgi:hypothetical protein